MSIPLLPDVEPDILFTNAWFTDKGHPAVYWQVRDRNGIISLTEARARAQALFQAVGYAEGEAAIAKGVFRLHEAANPRGFGSKPSAAREAVEMMAKLRQVIRDERSPLLEGIEVIFGLKTRRALINVSWYGEPVQWEIVQALEHAITLIETAEAAESDAFFRRFLTEQIGVSQEEAYGLIHEFGIFRQRRGLEDLFGGQF